CGALQPVKIDYSDTLVPRVGVDRTIPLTRSAVAHLRAGYMFEPTPLPSTIPASQAWNNGAQATGYVPTRTFDASRHVFTIGGGLELGNLASEDVTGSRLLAPSHNHERPVTLDFYAQLHALQPRTVDVAHGPNGEGDDPGFGPAKLTGTMLVAGLILGVTF
ncbi:MAG: hypothetical protein ABI461_18595, partial [Polyangiaceae bacterium]